MDLTLKNLGCPSVRLVPEGTPGATVVAVKRVSELSFYSLSLKLLAEKLGLNMPKVLALIRHQRIQESEDCYKEFNIGKAVFKRYSAIGLDRLTKVLPIVNIDEVWAQYGSKHHTT